jgi:hypothetical protein
MAGCLGCRAGDEGEGWGLPAGARGEFLWMRDEGTTRGSWIARARGEFFCVIDEGT